MLLKRLRCKGERIKREIEEMNFSLHGNLCPFNFDHLNYDGAASSSHPRAVFHP